MWFFVIQFSFDHGVREIFLLHGGFFDCRPKSLFTKGSRDMYEENEAKIQSGSIKLENASQTVKFTVRFQRNSLSNSPGNVPPYRTFLKFTD